MTDYAGRWTSLTLPSQRGTLQEILILPVSSKINLSSHPSHLDSMGCMPRGETVTVRLCTPGLRNRQNSTIPSVELHVEAFLLPHPPGPLARTCSGIGRACEQTLMCNQAAGLSRCLTRVQHPMSTQLKSLHLDTKGKSSEKLKKAVDERDYLVTFNRSISQAMARTMQDLSEGVFISMSNFTLARRDSYLEYLHAGVKQDTLNTLRTSPVHINSLFPDQHIAKAEEEISRSKRRSSANSHRRQSRFHPYSFTDKSTGHSDHKSGVPAWKQIRDNQQSRKGRGKASTFSQKPAKGSKPRK